MNKISYILLYLLFVVFIKINAQYPEAIWISTYGTANGFEGTNDCSADNNGSLFAVGAAEDPNQINMLDIIVIEYNTATGDTIKSWKYNGSAGKNDEASNCLLDAQGNLFVVGYSSNESNDDFILIKYNSSSGDIIYTSKYNGFADGNDRASGCSIDGSILYVTGYSYNGANNDILTIKYNTETGDTLWTRRFNGSADGDDQSYGCSVDASGNLYVSGYTYNGTSFNILTMKYNSAGDLIWTKKSDDTLDALRFPRTDCTTDIDGNIYVIGMCGENINLQNRYSVISKYNSSGDLLWVTKYDDPATYDQHLGCVLDGLGNLYVCGTSYDGSEDECILLRFDTISGNVDWSEKYIFGSALSAYGINCTIDNLGAIYVTGQTEIAGGGYDSFTIKYAADVTSAENMTNNLPGNLILYQNYPNPFNPSTKISYTLPNSEFVTIKIYDLLGREIETLVDEFEIAGTHVIEYEPGNLSSGTYFYKLSAGNDFVENKKMLLIK